MNIDCIAHAKQMHHACSNSPISNCDCDDDNNTKQNLNGHTLNGWWRRQLLGNAVGASPTN